MNQKLVRTNIYITERQKSFLEEYKKTRVVTKSVIIREAIDNYIREKKNEQNQS